MRMRAIVCSAVVTMACVSAGWGQREDFDLSRRKIPLEEIREGGPPKDGIPALLNPRFVSAAEADAFLQPGDRVLGVAIKGVKKAYPVKILVWHEAVNDLVGDQPVLVSY